MFALSRPNDEIICMASRKNEASVAISDVRRAATVGSTSAPSIAGQGTPNSAARKIPSFPYGFTAIRASPTPADTRNAHASLEVMTLPVALLRTARTNPTPARKISITSATSSASELYPTIASRCRPGLAIVAGGVNFGASKRVEGCEVRHVVPVPPSPESSGHHHCSWLIARQQP